MHDLHRTSTGAKVEDRLPRLPVGSRVAGDRVADTFGAGGCGGLLLGESLFDGGAS